MTRVLFIIPPYLSYRRFVNPEYCDRIIVKATGEYSNVTADMPIGLLSLSAYIKKHAAVEVRILDFNIILKKLRRFDYNTFADLYHDVLTDRQWQDFAPNIIGISTLFAPAYANMLELGEVTKGLFPDALNIAGGGIPTNLYDEIFQRTNSFDALCYGEGELPLLSLIQASDRKQVLAADPAWVTAEKVHRHESFQFRFIQNLDEIPFLDYGVLNLDDYRINPVQSLFPLLENKINLPYETSRGCPFSCCFCASHSVHGKKMRYYSIERIREDFHRMKKEFSVGEVDFFDDHLMAKKERFHQIVNLLKEADVTGFFPSALAMYALDRDVLTALKSVGVNHLVLSVESGSNRVLKHVMHKPLKLSIVERVIADCRDIGISTDVSIVMGLPGETKQDIADTREFLLSIHPTWFRISIATPLAGSEMYRICKENNYLAEDITSGDFKQAIVKTPDFEPAFIQKTVYDLNLELNFVNNFDFKSGNYDVALKGFENAIAAKSDHVFAYYYAAKCCDKLGLIEKGREYYSNYNKYLSESVFWQRYVARFGLEPNAGCWDCDKMTDNESSISV